MQSGRHGKAPKENRNQSDGVGNEAPLTDSPRLLTPQQAADWLQCSATTVYRLAEDGKIPSVRVGRLLRFSLEALQAWARGGASGRKD